LQVSYGNAQRRGGLMRGDTGQMQRIAIYDLDRTLLRKPTFTPFLMFAARKTAPWRLLLLPVWIAAMIGYRMGLYGRKPLKQFGIRLFVGAEIAEEKATQLAQEFTDLLIPSGLQRGAMVQMAKDKDAAHVLIIATAAQELYVQAMARKLGFDAILATRQIRSPIGGYLHQFEGENCYGSEKLRRITEFLDSQKITRNSVEIVFYTDHHSDAAVLDWADIGIIVNGNAGLMAMARTRGWGCQDWR
jgi:HAD superfamily hydrolase (TIGR01490 family)